MIVKKIHDIGSELIDSIKDLIKFFNARHPINEVATHTFVVEKHEPPHPDMKPKHLPFESTTLQNPPVQCYE